MDVNRPERSKSYLTSVVRPFSASPRPHLFLRRCDQHTHFPSLLKLPHRALDLASSTAFVAAEAAKAQPELLRPRIDGTSVMLTRLRKSDQGQTKIGTYCGQKSSIHGCRRSRSDLVALAPLRKPLPPPHLELDQAPSGVKGNAPRPHLVLSRRDQHAHEGSGFLSGAKATKSDPHGLMISFDHSPSQPLSVPTSVCPLTLIT